MNKAKSDPRSQNTQESRTEIKGKPCYSLLFQVSWLRRHDDDTPHLLTFGLTTYSNDARIQVA